jgi:DNA-binding NarL/FixJ family response regulator
MNRIIMLNEDLESQMRMYLALRPRYRIEIAENELTLMRLIRRKNPKLLLLDAHYSRFNHNGKSVVKLVEKIKRKYVHLPVVAIVNDEDERLGHQLQQRGADAWITRVIPTDDLLQRVDDLLDANPYFAVKACQEAEAAVA